MFAVTDVVVVGIHFNGCILLGVVMVVDVCKLCCSVVGGAGWLHLCYVRGVVVDVCVCACAQSQF